MPFSSVKIDFPRGGPKKPPPTVLLLAVSVAKNRGWLATLMTICRVKFRPSLLIFWHLEVWQGPTLALRLILKFPNFSLKTSTPAKPVYRSRLSSLLVVYRLDRILDGE